MKLFNMTATTLLMAACLSAQAQTGEVKTDSQPAAIPAAPAAISPQAQPESVRAETKPTVRAEQRARQAPPPATAQAPTPAPAASVATALVTGGDLMNVVPILQGKTSTGRDFDLKKIRGKAMMIFVWSSECPICIDKMKELRDNYSTWRLKPFELIGINIDPKVDEFKTYELLVGGIVHPDNRFMQLWSGESNFNTSLDLKNIPTKYNTGLPITYITNKSGQVVRIYRGRIPSEAWNDIADLVY